MSETKTTDHDAKMAARAALKLSLNGWRKPSSAEPLTPTAEASAILSKMEVCSLLTAFVHVVAVQLKCITKADRLDRLKFLGKLDILCTDVVGTLTKGKRTMALAMMSCFRPARNVFGYR